MAATAMGPAFQQLMAALKGVGGASMGLGKAAIGGIKPGLGAVGKGVADLTAKGGTGLQGLSKMLMQNPAMTGGAALGAGGLAGGLGLGALMGQGRNNMEEEISPELLQMLLMQLQNSPKNPRGINPMMGMPE
jgi:hypothetical protein